MMLFRYLSTSSNGPTDAVMCSRGLTGVFLYRYCLFSSFVLSKNIYTALVLCVLHILPLRILLAGREGRFFHSIFAAPGHLVITPIALLILTQIQNHSCFSPRQFTSPCFLNLLISPLSSTPISLIFLLLPRAPTRLLFI